MDKKKVKPSREIANVISNNIPFEKQQVSLVARPLRLAFIINDKLFPENLLRLLTYISSIWGGYYSCLIPTDGNMISDADWENLNVYDPDKVIFCANEAGTFSSELVTRITNEILPFSSVVIEDWNTVKDIFDIKRQRLSDPLVFSIPLIYPLVHLLDQQKQPIEEEKSNVWIPGIEQNHPLALFVAAQIGVVSDFDKKIYLEGFKAKEKGFVNNKIKEYLSFLGEFENRLTPLEMTQQFIQTTMSISTAPIPEGLNIVFVGNSFVKDLCLFWNLHLALNLQIKSKLLILPFDLFRTKKNLQELCDALKLSPWLHNKINIFSASVSMKRLFHFEERFREMFPLRTPISIERKSIPVAYFSTKNIEESDEVFIDKNTFSLKCLNLEFSNLLRGGEWAVDIKFKRPYEYPSFSKLNHLLNGSPEKYYIEFNSGYWIRASFEKLVHRANIKTNFVTGRLIRDEQAFEEVFRDKGYAFRLTDKHSYAEGFLKLLQTPIVLDDPKVIDFFWTLSKQDAYTFENLCGELKKGEDSRKIIDDFVSKRILIRGMEFRCGSCGLLRFYPINTLEEEMQCPGCLSRLQPPSRAPIMFSLNELAVRAIEQGSIPVVLTHKFIDKLQYNNSLRLFGTEVSKGELTIDIDYLTTFQGGIVLVECKDFKQGVLPKEKNNAIHQLKKLVELAKQVNASVVILSTLLPFPSPEYNDLAIKIETMKNRNKIPMHLLSLSGNGIVDLKHPEKLVVHPFLLD